ncbi:hypothetical protein B0T16DRAFT_321942 [Cercophora newfieldiana]|uniref:Post-SET domain-containing protein n=1 Tax=Cercophora newfieldiana TaxID=92897 RepID=A0AA39YH61_9PEZI|nr:hypothetical protein B0T16DRAFT_321942 [Cercophora newfieldiana]
MAPIKPHWAQPSHPDVQEVIVNEAEFTSKSLSKVALPPWGLFAKLQFPPCTEAAEPTYATVQYGRDKHLNLNSDLLYINHSCEPSLYFDMTAMAITAGPNGVQVGEELTFFYPSTEWYMAQPFDCLCGKETCRGRISGARDMTSEQLGNAHLNVHIRQLLAEKYLAESLQEATARAEKAAAAACRVLKALVDANGGGKHVNGSLPTNGSSIDFAYLGVTGALAGAVAGSLRRGPTSRELSGEMGGDTSVF